MEGSFSGSTPTTRILGLVSFSLRNLLEEFQANGSLTGDDGSVVEGVDESTALFGVPSQRLAAGFVVAGAVEDNLSPEAARGGDLDLRRGQRHNDLSANSESRGMERNPLRVVAGAGRDHAALALRLAEREQFVERAALFERARALQVLKLQVKWQAGQLGEVVGELARRDVDRFADAAAGGLDAAEGDGFQESLSFA
ncbi:MAG: hypothetical protein ABR898_12235 [Terracidiphilus sp.]